MIQVHEPPKSPLPVRDGVAPSYIWLQKGSWPTILDFLNQRFPEVGSTVWLGRLDRGDVVDESGQVLTCSSPYFWGRRIFYYREIELETPVPFKENILFRDAHLLVVDKPHFLPVIPTGRFLHETLLVRLKDQLKLDALTPIHRLDRETAGVMIFSLNRQTRGAYQSLFQQRSVRKKYQALARHLNNYAGPFVYQSRLVPGTPFFRMQEMAGTPNSETAIALLEQQGNVCRYQLEPLTGRKHQLRVHMAALGIPILNDAFYPAALPCKGDDFSQPLKLLSQSIQFVDPLTGLDRCFESDMKLLY